MTRLFGSRQDSRQDILPPYAENLRQAQSNLNVAQPAFGPPIVHPSRLSLSAPASHVAGIQSPSSVNDSVHALVRIDMSVPVIVVLHSSGRICAYALSRTNLFALAGEITLPGSLAASAMHFLEAAGESGSLFAIVTIDEDPQPHAICVFTITLSMDVARRVSITCLRVVHRTGPVDRLVGAVIMPSQTDLAVATEAGHVSLLRIPSLKPQDEEHTASGQGLPSGTIWTFQDDLTHHKGLWHAVDCLQDVSIGDRLLAARRFSPAVIGKALRLPQMADMEYQDLERVVEECTRALGSEEASRVLMRAQRSSIVMDAPISGLSYVHGAGVVVSRQCGLLVLRPLLDCEIEFLQIKDTHERFTDGVRSALKLGHRQDLSNAVAQCVAVHAIAQLASAELSRLSPDSEEASVATCILSLSMRMSQRHAGRTVSELANSWKLSTVSAGIDVSDLLAAVNSVRSVLMPGCLSLRAMAALGEMRALRVVAEMSSKLWPVSCLFALGLVFLWEVELASTRANDGVSTAVAIDEGDQGRHDNDWINACCVNAYSSFVAASKFAGNLIRSGQSDARREDISCVWYLGTPLSLSETDNSVPDVVQAQLDFWILERSLRLLDCNGAIRAAAAAALEALSVAPNRKLYEMMRAAAFQRFLDVGDLNSALLTILKEAYEESGPVGADLANIEDSAALCDCVGLLVNAAVDAGRFAWLLVSELPLPVKEYVAHALERRARSCETFAQDSLLRGLSGGIIDGATSPLSTSSPYEYLYAWHLAREDITAAAQCALEWYERVSLQGLSQIRTFSSSSGGGAGSKSTPTTLLIMWTRMKAWALGATCTAVKRLPAHLQYLSRSRYSVSASSTSCSASNSGVVDAEWISRRHLLARAQLICLARNTNVSAGLKTDYLLTHAEYLLGDGEAGVNFAVSSLLSAPASKNSVHTAVDLALAWLPDGGKDRVLQVVRAAAVLACNASLYSLTGARCDPMTFSALRDMLDMVTTTAREANVSSRNWYLEAAEGALEGSAYSIRLPHWLTDMAAWGSTPRGASTIIGSLSRKSNACCAGDPASMVRLWLRHNRPADAALTLISGMKSGLRWRAPIHVPHSAVNATLEMLSNCADDSGDSMLKLRAKLLDLANTCAAHVEATSAVRTEL
jgi:hypothetical protein